VDRHLAADVLPDAARRITAHTTDRNARTGVLYAEAAGTSSEALTISRSYLEAATSGDEEHRKSDVFIKKTETGFSLKTYRNGLTAVIL